MRSILEKEELNKYIPHRESLLQQVVDTCKACALINPNKAKLNPAIRLRGHRPGEHWEIDFTEIKPGMHGYQYL